MLAHPFDNSIFHFGSGKPPGLLVVVDPNKEHIAVAEANKLGIPVMGLVDTNCDPDPVDYVIACNDDALKSIKLIIQALSDRIIDRKTALNIAIQRDIPIQYSCFGSWAIWEGK
ncbi:30S ribosomal protein S2 [Klebsiella pneumoniae]|uniref:30S ribosomal protein S2 n=1 Tax=Klebsiella pneumoniae TaxID=573 RepID=UPI002E8001C6|nr:30S ribosomal protein S2 [Klebsiella pneumoniae]MEE2399731.1 30S ribosomal protein S2 [Klebsiella pneumoniae]